MLVEHISSNEIPTGT